MCRPVYVLLAHASIAWCCAGGARAETFHSSCTACVDQLESHATELAELRARNARLTKELEECRAAEHGLEPTQSRRRRALMAIPAPTPLTAVPTPITPVPTTAPPSASPSTSPVPTTEGITTHAQLIAAVDGSSEAVMIEADIIFPSQAPVVVTGTVSVFGNECDGGRCTLDGHGRSRLFYVLGGTLHLAYLNLANGTAPETAFGWLGGTGGGDHRGGAILVEAGGTLEVRSCDIRGGGPGVDPLLGNAYVGGGVYLGGPGTTGEFHDVVFSNHLASWGGILLAEAGAPDAMVEVHFFGCKFLDSGVNSNGNSAVLIGFDYVKSSFYACLFEGNRDAALLLCAVIDVVPIVQCIFRENVGSASPYLPGAGAGGLVVSYNSNAEVIDSVFERNSGAQGNDGGGMSVYNGASATLRNVSFLANDAPSGQGGSFTVTASSSLVCIKCYSLDAKANGMIIARIDGASSLVVYNSTFAESISVFAYGIGVWDGSSVAMYNSVFRDMEWNGAGLLVVSESTALLSDCMITGLRGTYNAVWEVTSGGSLRLVRTTLRDNRGTTGSSGCGEVYGGATLEIVDSDVVGCVSAVTDGAAVVTVESGGSATIIDSRLDGNIGTHNGVIATVVGDASTLRIVRSTITNTSGPFAINDMTETDFSVQLDTITVDSTFDIISRGAVLVQNCHGLSSTAVKNASIGTCGSTSDFCIPESCADEAVGIECMCFVDGLLTVTMYGRAAFRAKTVI